MGMLRWVLGGVAGGVAGGAIWVAVGYFTEYEIGWIAWGIGFLVGVGVRYGAHLGNQDETFAQGMIASVMAIGSILAAKFVLFSLLVHGPGAVNLGDLVAGIPTDDDSMIASFADDIAQDMTNRNQPIAWPPGMSYEDASRKEDYPAVIWHKAETRWNELDAEAKQERKRMRTQLAAAMVERLKPDFTDCFSPWDLLWVGLAAVTAFKVGVGSHGES